MSDNQKIVRMRPARGLNVGVVIFTIIIIYVIFNIFSYLTSTTVAEYEVTQGTIATNNTYHGLIIRDETICYAGQNGYVNYYVKNNSKIAVTDIIYSIDTTGKLAKKIASAITDGTTLSSSVIDDLSENITLFYKNYDSNHFEDVTNFKDDLNSQLTETLSVTALETLSDAVTSAEANNTFYRKSSDQIGVITYYVDGYENTSVDNFTPDQLNGAGYHKTTFVAGSEVAASDPVYKRINSESWNIITQIPDSLAKQLADSSYIKIRICKDNYTATVPFSIGRKNGSYFINLSLNTAMIRYIDERFVDIELILSENSGLKIPNSAITQKDFFTIPKSFFTSSGDSGSSKSLLVRSSEGDKATLVKPTIYNESDDYYYVDNESVSAGDVLLQSDSSKTYTVGQDTDTLTGVYNINKGYAVFKQIHILSQNETYAIVEMKTSYGIALYDHIALDGSKMKENQLVVK